MNSIAWRSPSPCQLPMEINPRVIEERSRGDGPNAVERAQSSAEDRSILDFGHPRSRPTQTRL